MKSLQESLLDDEEDLIKSTGPEKLIEDFLLNNYSVYNVDGNTPMKYKIYKKSGKWYVDVDCVNIQFINDNAKHLTNGLFQFGKVGNFLENTHRWSVQGFRITSLNKIEDLVGAPEEIIGDLDCRYCDSLKSLKGCPKKISRYMNLEFCKNLKDIKDMKNLKYVGGMITTQDGTNISKEDIRKYVPEKVCQRVYGNY